MKKLILLSLLLMAVAGVQAVSLRQISLEITDEFWQPVTNITQISVFDAGTSSATTIFSDRAGTIEMTNPITTGSTASTFLQSLGQVRWFQRAPDYKVTITDGSKNLTIDDRTGSVTRFPWFDNYIGTAASLSFNDNQSFTAGTDSDATLSWVNSTDILQWIPLSDSTKFNIGSTTVTKQFDFNVFVGGIGGGGLAIDEGAASFVWTGGAFAASGGIVSLNASSNSVTNINTGTSTAAVNIGSSTAGNISLDTTLAVSINADDSVDITTSANSADIDIDAQDGSIIIDGGQSAQDAVLITATGGTGGIQLVAVGDILLDSGDDIFLAADTGVGDVISIINTQGTNASSLILRTVATGSIDIDSGEDVTVDTTDDILLTSGDDTVIVTTGALTITNTEAMTVSGALTVTGDTQLISVTRIDTPIEIVAATNAIEITESGTVYVLTNATEYATTLPTVASSAGVTYRFICGAVPSGDDYTVLTDTLEDKISGSVTVDGAAVAADGPDDTITFTRDAAAIGDWCELTSDGVLWYLSGQAVASTGIVPSKAD